MAASQAHEDIIDDVREIYWDYKRKFSDTYPCIMLIERMIPHFLMDLQEVRLIADAYLFIADEATSLFLEIGNMRDGKWRYVRAPDGLPVRILRVEFDRSTWIVNPRGTKAELHFWDFLTNRL